MVDCPRVMIVERNTIDKAFGRFVIAYEKWSIPHQLGLYQAGEKAFEGSGDETSFRKIYDALAGGWQALRPKPKGIWEADRAFREFMALSQEFRKRKLSELDEPGWQAVWDCMNHVRAIKPNKSGPSLVAISKFLHFWNPHVFVIVDGAKVQGWVFGHKWLSNQLPPLDDLPRISEADDQRTSRLIWYLRVLRWAAEVVRANPHICEAFAATVRDNAGGEKVPDDIETYEATAVEWFLLGLVELPPCGVKL